jgi:hypothetical protein
VPLATIAVALLVSTQTGTSQTVVDQLRDEVARIYATADIAIRWVDPSEPQTLTITLVRDIPPIRGCESAFGCTVHVVGTTPPTAFIATRAIWNYERPRPLLRGRLLAYVVAHELGHLIGLPHSDERGLMFKNTQWLPYIRWTLKEKTRLAALLMPATSVAQRDPDTLRARPEVLNAERTSR